MVWPPFTRADHARNDPRYASDTTDREWYLIAPFMPPQPARGRNCQWGLLPKDFPPKSTVHYYFKRFCADGTWTRIHDALYRQTRDLEGREESPSYAIIDSQSSKTGPDAH